MDFKARRLFIPPQYFYEKSLVYLLKRRIFVKNYTLQYPKTHKRHFISHLNHLYWTDVYGHTRKDNEENNYKKGFIVLKFD